MNYGFLKINNLFLLFFLFYLTLITGFIFDENLNFGALRDWKTSDYTVINDLSLNFKETFLNYDSYGHRHSPVYLIFLSLLKIHIIAIRINSEAEPCIGAFIAALS